MSVPLTQALGPMTPLRFAKALSYLAIGGVALWYGAVSLIDNHTFGSKFSQESSALVLGVVVLLIGLVSTFIGLGKLVSADPTDNE